MQDRYLELLSDFDLQILGAASQMGPDNRSGGSDGPVVDWFRAGRGRATTAVAQRHTYDSLIGNETVGSRVFDNSLLPRAHLADDTISVEPSPFLLFAVLIEHGAATLCRSALRVETIAGHTLLPLTENRIAAETSSNPQIRLYLAELLDSFSVARATRSWDLIAPGAATPINDQDPVHLARAIHLLDANETPGLLRRLGDAALFAAGLRGTTAAAPLIVDDLAAVIETLPAGLRSNGGAELSELFAHEPRHRVFSELGPIWYRMAAKQLRVPALQAPLIDMADHFDDATAFLRFLRSNFSLHRSTVLTG